MEERAIAGEEGKTKGRRRKRVKGRAMMQGESMTTRAIIQGESMQNRATTSVPKGYKFIPSGEELIYKYLCPRIFGHVYGTCSEESEEQLNVFPESLPFPIPNELGKPRNVIFDYNIYEKEPWLLPHDDHTINGGVNGQNHFTLRSKKFSNGKPVNRKLSQPKGEGGWWKGNGLKPIQDKQGYIIGFPNTFSFFK